MWDLLLILEGVIVMMSLSVVRGSISMSNVALNWVVIFDKGSGEHLHVRYGKAGSNQGFVDKHF
jgi:hypothetical protein